MEYLTIIFLLFTLAIVLSFGKMMYLDLSDIFKGLFCFDPGKITFKDKKGIWNFVECERKARFYPFTHFCDHNSSHNLTRYNFCKKGLDNVRGSVPEIVKDVMSGKFNNKTNLKEYYKGRK